MSVGFVAASMTESFRRMVRQRSLGIRRRLRIQPLRNVRGRLIRERLNHGDEYTVLVYVDSADLALVIGASLRTPAAIADPLARLQNIDQSAVLDVAHLKTTYQQVRHSTFLAVTPDGVAVDETWTDGSSLNLDVRGL
jgi:hypothetical protein